MTKTNAAPGERAVQDYTEKISFGEKLAYGSGDFACNLISFITLSIVTFFYTDTLGLNPTIIGSIMLFSRLADGVSDIIMGHIVDRTNTKYGKARPWLLWVSVPIAVSTVLVFMVPQLGEVGQYVYIAVTYNLVSTFLFTMISLPYGTLTSLLTRDQNQRMSVNIYRIFMAQVGSLLISAVTLPLINGIGNGGTANQTNWIIVAALYGTLAGGIYLWCFFKTEERVKVSSQRREKVPFGRSILLLFKNSYWVMLLVVWISIAFNLSISMGMGTYYAKYILGDENIAGYLNALMLIPGILIMPFSPWFCKKYGKRNFALAGSIVGLAGQVIMCLQPQNLTVLMAGSVIKGIGFVTSSSTIYAMVADSVEYGQWKTGTRLEGMIFASTTFGQKFATAISSALTLFIMGAAGYNGMLAVQTPRAMSAIKGMFMYLPLLFLGLLPVLYFAYKLDKRYPEIMADLAKREAEGGQ